MQLGRTTCGCTGLEIDWTCFTQVAGNMPTSRGLWKDWSVYWPISWRPPEPHLSCDVPEVSNEFQKNFEMHMQFAFHQASANKVGNCAVVVDPSNGR